MAKVRIFDELGDSDDGVDFDAPIPVSIRRPRLLNGGALPTTVGLMLLNKSYGKMVIEFSLYEAARLVEEFSEIGGIRSIVHTDTHAGDFEMEDVDNNEGAAWAEELQGEIVEVRETCERTFTGVAERLSRLEDDDRVGHLKKRVDALVRVIDILPGTMKWPPAKKVKKR